MANRYIVFDNGELYMLKRQAMESSYYIVCEGDYSKYELEIHERLMRELIAECKRRGI